MKKTIGIFAHVDAGKTTLSEMLLYMTDAIRSKGKIEDKNTILDYNETEKRRGITIFPDVANFVYGENQYYIVDTPGHMDFAPHSERVLSVIDAAVLVISATDGVQAHTKTLWHMLEKANKPVYIFINKSDIPTADKRFALSSLNDNFGNCVDFSCDLSEEIALYSEELFELYGEKPRDLRYHNITAELVSDRKIFPCYYGSALNGDGVEAFLFGLDKLLTADYEVDAPFSGYVFKVSHSADGKRICFIKVMSGTLTVKDKFQFSDSTEKINEIRFFMGSKSVAAQKAEAGDICGVSGLLSVGAGQVIGEGEYVPLDLSPAIMCSVYSDSNTTSQNLLDALEILEDEEPTLNVTKIEELSDIRIHIMGKIQLEILQEELLLRFGINARFGECRIIYRETISENVYGFGHYEPLRHYAEVHLELSPMPCGSGISFESDLHTDILGKNFQNLIKTHIFEKKHIGVLTGSAVTDIKFTLKNGRAHEKHTSGGDFRQATYRAVRQGLFGAKSVLLEPVFSFEVKCEPSFGGKVISDIQKMCGRCDPIIQNGDFVCVTGIVPVASSMDYQSQLLSETGGKVQISLRNAGYEPCHNAEQVISEIGYDKDRDTDNPATSVFVSHGAAYVVSPYEAKEYMHLELPNI